MSVNEEVRENKFDVVINVKPFNGKNATIVFDMDKPPILVSTNNHGEVKIALNQGDYIEVPIEEPSFTPERGIEFSRLYVAGADGKLTVATDSEELRIPFDDRIGRLYTQTLKHAITKPTSEYRIHTFAKIYLEMALSRFFNIPEVVIDKFLDELNLDNFHLSSDRLEKLTRRMRTLVHRPYERSEIVEEGSPFIFIDSEFNFVNSSQLGDTPGFITTEEKSEKHRYRSTRLHEKWIGAIYVATRSRSSSPVRLIINASTDLAAVKKQIDELLTAAVSSVEILYNESNIKGEPVPRANPYDIEPLASATCAFDWERFDTLNKQHNINYFEFSMNESRFRNSF